MPDNSPAAPFVTIAPERLVHGLKPKLDGGAAGNDEEDMALSRWGECDLYIFGDTDSGIHVMVAGNEFNESAVLNDWASVLSYALEHRDLGYDVPDDLIDDLIDELIDLKRFIEFWQDCDGEWWAGRAERLHLGSRNAAETLFRIQTGPYYRNWCMMRYYTL